MQGDRCLRRNIPMHGEIPMVLAFKGENEAESPSGEIQNHEKGYDEPTSMEV